MLAWTAAFPLTQGEAAAAQCSGALVDAEEWEGLNYCPRSVSEASFMQS